MRFFAIVDCNNFYVSCERVFNPALKKVPVAVLSNNDGCIIARSNEVKALGVPMGAPYFTYRSFLHKHGATVLSSNYELYGDMSARVMDCITQHFPHTQVYSIDEAFIQLDGMTRAQAHTAATTLQQTIVQWTGIPVSIGIAPTKTLAKVANRFAKVCPHLKGIYAIEQPNEIAWLLEQTAVGDIWGIGRRYAAMLQSHGIHNAWHLQQADDAWIRKKMTIIGLKTVWELRGTACFALEHDDEPKQSIACTRSFGTAITSLAPLKEAVATYAARAMQKARAQQSGVCSFYLFIRTGRHDADGYANGRSYTFSTPCTFTPDLIKQAHRLLMHLYRPGYRYKKAGIVLTQLAPSSAQQLHAFAPHTNPKHEAVMQAMEQIQEKWGTHRTRFAAQGIKQEWKMKRAHTSPCYTTQWRDILKVS